MGGSIQQGGEKIRFLGISTDMEDSGGYSLTASVTYHMPTDRETYRRWTDLALLCIDCTQQCQV